MPERLTDSKFNLQNAKVKIQKFFLYLWFESELIKADIIK